MDWAELLIEFVKAIIWPSVVLVLGLTFKDDMKKLFPRVVKAGPTGIEFEAQKQTVAYSYTGELRELPGISRTNTITTLEKKIHDELRVINPDAHVDLLVRHLAQAQLQTAFERIYGIMFGSQVAELRALANAGGAAPRTHAIKFFDEQVEIRPDLKGLQLKFDDWIRYLVGSNLVVDDGENIAITDFGRDFLLYLAATRGNEVKAG